MHFVQMETVRLQLDVRGFICPLAPGRRQTRGHGTHDGVACSPSAPTFSPLCPRMVFFLEDVLTCTKRLLEWIAGWLPRHCIGAILVSLPALAVYSHITSEFETNINVSSCRPSSLHDAQAP